MNNLRRRLHGIDACTRNLNRDHHHPNSISTETATTAPRKASRNRLTGGRTSACGRRGAMTRSSPTGPYPASSRWGDSLPRAPVQDERWRHRTPSHAQEAEMAVEAKKAQPMLPEQLVEMLALAKQSDSVELKLTVPDSDQRSAISALNMDPLEAQIRQVFFFDTPDLSLNKQGVVVRARRVQGKSHDSVVKLRPVVPDMLPAKFRRSPSLTTEVDAMPGGFVCSAAMKSEVDPTF